MSRCLPSSAYWLWVSWLKVDADQALAVWHSSHLGLGASAVSNCGLWKFWWQFPQAVSMGR